MGARRFKHQDTGAGKSSLINLLAGKEVARTSPDMQRCTMHWREYNIGFGDTSYKSLIPLDSRHRNWESKSYRYAAEQLQALSRIPLREKIPIVLATTNLERERGWRIGGREQGAFDNYQIKVVGHACIAAANRLDGRRKDLYEESRHDRDP
ncbi:hypothetical protein DFJ58DRAFT_845940 [Suillus subalutaceus]|uniref:uncharacterized protein n=1 Tax=Suillus subalutaceus TaxID=48586 RepID=UPI001B87D82F|nr:uncharacterized protein DFJ58DRAFT_845940 [Suillus subalutaceus]KAG1838828.1 hypothetical protein DFJ58DRAFT_845940 [Suillus subalutaceus]